MDKDKNGARRSQQRRKHAWADIYEVIEESGPEGDLRKVIEKWRYDGSKRNAPWPTRRDGLNVLVGAAAALTLVVIASLPV